MMLDSILRLDGAILLFIQENLRNPILTAILVFFTKLGDKGYLWIAVGAVLLLTKKHRRSGVYILLSLGVGFIITNLLLKNAVMRIRPYDAMESLVPLVPKLTDWSFPSGHSCSCFAGAHAISERYEKFGALAYAVAVIISFSRLYVGVHYPTDAIVGAVIGYAGSTLFFRFAVPYLDRIKPKEKANS